MKEIEPDLAFLEQTSTLFDLLGQALGLKLHRLCLYGSSRGEVEFAAPNPVEVQVFKWASMDELREVLAYPNRERSVFRKKCIKCLMHERPGG